MFKRVISIYILGFLFSILLYACCEEIYRATTNYTVDFKELQEDTIVQAGDTIRGPFVYQLEAEIIREVVSIQELSLIQRSYALSCDMTYENAFVSETASVRLDKDFMIDSHVVKAGTNLLFIDWEARGNPYKLSEDEFQADVYFSRVDLAFKEDVMDRVHFFPGDYTFRTVIELEEGERIVSEETRTILIP